MNKFISIIAFAIGLAAVKYGIDVYQDNNAVASLENSMQQLKKDAALKHPNMQASEAEAIEAAAQTNTKLSNETDADKRQLTAASTFIGFYFVNNRSRPEFCNELGVDISTFVTAFESNHSSEITKARALLAKASYQEDKLYELTKPQLQQAVAQDMNDIASKNNVTPKGACELVAESGKELASVMHISKIQPAVYHALMDN